MTLIDEVKRLREENLELKGALVKERVLRIKNSWPEWTDDRKITADAVSMLSEELPQITFDDESHDAAPDLLAVLGGFQKGDADLLDLFADFVSHFAPDGHLNDEGKGATITNRDAADSLKRLANMAWKMEASGR